VARPFKVQYRSVYASEYSVEAIVIALAGDCNLGDIQRISGADPKMHPSLSVRPTYTYM